MFVLSSTVGTVPFPPRAGKGGTSESEVARGETLEEFMVALFAALCEGKDRPERDDLHEDLQEWFVWGEAKAKHAAAREAHGTADLKLVHVDPPAGDDGDDDNGDDQDDSTPLHQPDAVVVHPLLWSDAARGH